MISYCPVCGKPVYFAERKRSLGKDYHPLCLKCNHCKRQLSPSQHAEHDDKPFCNNCYLLLFGPRDQFAIWNMAACREKVKELQGTCAMFLLIRSPASNLSLISCRSIYP